MKMLFLYICAVFVAVSGQQPAPLLHSDAKEVKPGEYVVQLNEDADLNLHLEAVNILRSIDNSTRVLTTFSIGMSFKGYGIKCSEKILNAVLSIEGVQHAEPNQIYRASQASCVSQKDAPWGLVRTTLKKDNKEDTFYSFNSNSAGKGVNIYIVDTGIDMSHPLFGGRALWGDDFIDNPSPKTDLNGHGTHVAGTVVSDAFGLAREGTAIAVRVLDQNGSGSTAGVINGFGYAASKHSQGDKSILNASLGGGKSTTMNNAVEAAFKEGVFVVVAAGNEGSDAGNVSPASSPYAYTVCASDSSDMFAYFSNYGDDVNICGPGVNIESLWLNGGLNTISGTSMASPHVAGVAAKYWSDLPTLTAATLKAMLDAEADKAAVNEAGSAYNLIFKSCETV